MCRVNYALHPCQHTTYYGYHPCALARHNRILCISNNTRDPNPPPTIHVPPYPRCSNPTHTPPTLATIPSPFSNPAHFFSRPDTLLLTTSVSRLDFTSASNAATAITAIRPKPTSDYPFPRPVGFGTHGAAFGLDTLMDGGFKIPPPPTAKLQYVERKTTTHLLKVGAKCRACKKEEEERQRTMGQRFGLGETNEIRERQRLVTGMAEGLRGLMGERKRKRGKEVEDLLRSEEWWGDGVTEMEALLEKEKEALEMEESMKQSMGEHVERAVEQIVEQDQGRDPVAEAGEMDTAKPKEQSRRFFRNEHPVGTIEGGGVFSGFRNGQHENVWRWDGRFEDPSMANASGANLNLEILDSGISQPEFEMDASGQTDMLTQRMETTATDPAMQASLDGQTLTGGHFPDERINNGRVIFEEDDVGFTISSTLANEMETSQQIGDGEWMWGGEDGDSVLGRRMVDGTMSYTGLDEALDAFVRGMSVGSDRSAGQRVGEDGLEETVMRDGGEVDEHGARVTENTLSEIEEDEAVQRDDDSGSEYELSDA